MWTEHFVNTIPRTMPVRTYVYRLHPTRAQHAQLQTILRDQRHLYNAALQERREAWSKSGISVKLNDQTKSLTEIRHFDDAYGGVPYNISKWTLKRLDDAFKGFFRRLKSRGKAGFPRFRTVSRWNSFGLHQIAGVRLRDLRLAFSGGITGGLKIRKHRPLPKGSVIRSAVFTREAGIWRVALSCQVPEYAANDDGNVLGIDVGVNYLATDSSGRHYENLRPQAAMSRRVRIAQRAVARGRKGSKRRRKTVAKLQRLKRTERNSRTTHFHDVANAIVRSASTIVVEDLKLKNMTRSARGTLATPGKNVRQKAGLNRVLQDAASGRLISMIAYKAESAGGRVIKVDPKNTSRTCSACGIVDAAQLSRSRYLCGCGLDLQRGYNAAINIKLRGIQTLHEVARGLEDANVAGCRKRRPVNADPLAA